MQKLKVFSATTPNTTTGSVDFPHVMEAPIRSDIVQFVFSNLNKNKRQAIGVNKDAGMMYNAESWGTGRAVARIPRVGGSGTHRSGQAAFGNMCRGGRMFNPNTTWRRWHRKVNLTQRRHALASAVAASAVPSLVLARGHRVNQIPQVPLIVDNLNIEKTSSLIAILERLGLKDELDKSRNTKKIRVGHGKTRNRRYVTRKGPLIVFSGESGLLTQSARNIPGVELCHVDRLNLLQLAPGGHLGRLIIWTKAAFERLNYVFGTCEETAPGKRGYLLERPLLNNANLSRIINSDEVQSALRTKRTNSRLHESHKRNPLKNRAIMHKLNPYDKVRKAAATKSQEDAKKSRSDRIKQRRANRKKFRKQGRKFISNYRKELEGANKDTIDDYANYIKATKIGTDIMAE